MKELIIKYAYLQVIIISLFTSLTVQAKDLVFQAMQDELNRSMQSLIIEDMSPPYFLSYQVRDIEIVEINASYGALVKSEHTENRYLYTDLRVGSPARDNSNYISAWQEVFNMRDGLVEENDYSSLRHQLWLLTDKAYKKAAENLARKEAYLQTHPSGEIMDDFSTAESVVQLGEAPQFKLNQTKWEDQVRQAAQKLRDFTKLEDWKVNFSYSVVNKRYLNSEGSQFQDGFTNHRLEVSATIQAKDGQRLTGFFESITCDDEEPLPGEALLNRVQQLGEELEEMAKANSLDEYVGPVLFCDFATAQFISQLFVRQLTPVQLPLLAEDWMNQYLQPGKLGGRLNRRIFPDFVTIIDEPTRKTWQNQNLLGFRSLDDEAVPCQRITLVSDGRLQTLPNTRQPTKKIPQSNGHAVALQNQWNIPAATNLFVETGNPLSEKKLIDKLQKLAKDFGNEYGLLITLLEEERYSQLYRWTEKEPDQQVLLTAPVIMYKVYAGDGHLEPVRGLEFDEVSIRTMRDVAAMGKEARVYNIAQSTVLPGDFYYPASIVTPAVLVEEMELKAVAEREPLPVSPRPLVKK